jgi:hypothetical protein
MSAEHLAEGDLIHCLHCHRWHLSEKISSGSATDYAALMLYIRCGPHLYFVGAEGSPARDPKRVRDKTT